VYFWRSSFGPVDLAFTDRYGGVSGAPYAELNLALESADDLGARATNHRLLMDDFAPGDVLVDLRQVHGARVAVAEEDGATSSGDLDPAGRPEADAVVTTRSGMTLMVRAADCVPVLLADPDAGVVGAAHCGRPGLAAGVVPATVERMRQLGARRISGWIGPHVCGACYEVPEELRDEIAADVPSARASTRWGAPSLDLGAGVRAQLEAEDVAVVAVAGCTREDPTLYSYRRDGAGAGRLAGVIRRRGSAR
jgi:YfiH family protein